MFIQILSHTPAWVWAILAAITVLGGMQLQTRRLPRWRVVALPGVLLVLGLSSMASGFAAHPLAAGLWLVALVVAAIGGRRLGARAGAVWLPEPQLLQVPGSALPLVMALTVFLLRYANGVAKAVAPALTGQATWQAVMALMFGLLSGLFLGRALGLLGTATAAPAGSTMDHDERQPAAHLRRHGA